MNSFFMLFAIEIVSLVLLMWISDWERSKGQTEGDHLKTI